MKKLLFVIVVVLAILIQFQTSNAKENSGRVKEVKEWTFLTFMNGHDGMLTHYVEHNLELMKKVGSTDEINVVVQAASLDREETERLYIEKGATVVLEKMPRIDMGDYNELKKFIAWTVENYPAKKYFINVWNHGLGWHDMGTRSMMPAMDIMDVSLDSLTGNLITTEQMGDVMKYFADLTGNKVELYGNDACLMAMAEIAAEFSDTVSYFASSQENEPAAGWPYDKLLERWAAKPQINGRELGIILAEEYLIYYPDKASNPMGTTFSVIDVSKLDDLMSAIAVFVEELVSLDPATTEKIVYAAQATHRFDGANDYRDLLDFIKNIEGRKDIVINKSTLEFVRATYNSVMIKNVANELEEGAHGLSVWLPTYHYYYTSHAERYANLEFNKKTKWGDLISKFFSTEIR